MFAENAMYQAKIFLPNGSTQSLPLQAANTPDGLLLTLKQKNVPAKFTRIELLPNYFNATAGQSGYYLLPHVHGCRLASFTPHENAEYCLNSDNRFMPLCGKKSADKAELLLSLGMRDQTRFGAKVENGVYSLIPYLPACTLYEDISLLLITLPGANADYSAMARCYRNYLLKNGLCTRLSERAKTRPILKYLAEAPEIRIRMGWKPAPSPVAHQTPENEPEMKVACTFADVERLIAELQAQGVEKASLCLVGWNKSGHDGRYPQIFPVEEKLGGEAGLRRLIKTAKAASYKITCHTNSTDAYQIAENWSDDLILKTQTGELETEKAQWSGGKMYHLCPKKAKELAEQDLPRVRELGFEGLHYIDVISVVAPRTCFDKDHPVNAKQCVNLWRDILALSTNLFGAIASEGTFDHACGVLDFGLYSGFGVFENNVPLFGQSVPFWQLVYHGIVLSNPSSETVNFPVKEPIERLHFYEFGGRPAIYYYSNFHGTSSWMGKNDFTMDTPRQLRGSVQKIKALCSEYSRYSHLQMQFMQQHDLLTPTLHRVQYESGETLYLNYANEPQSVDGVTVPAMDLLLKA